MDFMLTVLGVLAMAISLGIVVALFTKLCKLATIAYDWVDSILKKILNWIFKLFASKKRELSLKNRIKAMKPKPLESWGGWLGIVAMCLMLLASVGIFIYAYFTYGNMREFWELEFWMKTPVFYFVELVTNIFAGETALFSVENITEITLISAVEMLLCGKFPKKNTAIFLLYSTIVALFMPLLTYVIPTEVYALPLHIGDLYSALTNISFNINIIGIILTIGYFLLINLFNLCIWAIAAFIVLLAIRETLASLKDSLIPLAIVGVFCVIFMESPILDYIMPVITLIANVVILAWRSEVWPHPLQNWLEDRKR